LADAIPYLADVIPLSPDDIPRLTDVIPLTIDVIPDLTDIIPRLTGSILDLSDVIPQLLASTILWLCACAGSVGAMAKAEIVEIALRLTCVVNWLNSADGGICSAIEIIDKVTVR
jgi:hypothetical protein